MSILKSDSLKQRTVVFLFQLVKINQQQISQHFEEIVDLEIDFCNQFFLVERIIVWTVTNAFIRKFQLLAPVMIVSHAGVGMI